MNTFEVMRSKIFATLLSRTVRHGIRIRWPQNTLYYLKIVSTFRKNR